MRLEERAPALTAYPTVTEGRPPPSPHRVGWPPSPAPSTPPHEAVVATFELLYLVRKALALQKQSRFRVLSGRPALRRGAEGRSPIWEGAKAGGASGSRGRYNRAGPRQAYRRVGKEAWGHSPGRELGAEASPFNSISGPFRPLCGAGSSKRALAGTRPCPFSRSLVLCGAGARCTLGEGGDGGPRACARSRGPERVASLAFPARSTGHRKSKQVRARGCAVVPPPLGWTPLPG